MAKKTVKVVEILDWANSILANPNFSAEFKGGVISTLEKVLHSSGNYHGFKYNEMYDSFDPEFDIGGTKNASRFYFYSPILHKERSHA